MKTKIMLFALLFFCVGSALAEIKIPAPVGYVNDFAGKLTAQQVADLDKKLRDYDKQTSIQFVIVITPSLQDRSKEEYSLEVGRQWKVGNKGIDGFVLLWAPTERKYFLQVGLHQEAYLTDGMAGQILREHLVPYLKADKGYEGLNETADSIISYLGADGPARREEIRQQAAEAARIKSQADSAYWGAIISTILWLLFFGGIVVVVVWGFLKIKFKLSEMRRKNRLRLQLSADLVEYRKEIVTAAEGIHDVFISAITNLKMHRDLNKLIELNEEASENIRRESAMLDKVSDLIQDNPDAARKLMRPLNLPDYNRAKREMIWLEEGFAQMVKDAPGKVDENQQKCLDVRKSLEGLVKDGYKINIEKELSDSASLMKSAKAHLETKNYDPEAAIDKSGKSLKSAENRLSYFTGLGSLQKSTVSNIFSINADLSKTSKLQNSVLSGGLRALMLYPKSVWKDVKSRFDQLGGEKWTRDIRGKLASAQSLNSMEVQDFEGAQKLVSDARDLLSDVKDLFAKPKTILDSLSGAKRECGQMLAKLSKDLANAPDKLNDSDVGPEAKRTLAKANHQFDLIKGLSITDVYQDWLEIQKSLASVSDLLQQSLSQAQRDKAAAQSARDRKRREERQAADEDRRRRQREEDDRRRRSSYDSSSSSSSSWSSSSSDSGGFSGGGGDFGGGGAGGSY